jgi:ABC-2 type transport system permease protein
MKIYFRWRTWILAALLIAMVVLISYVQMITMGNSNGDWKAGYEKQMASLESMIQSEQLSAADKERIQGRIRLYAYSLEHNIPPMNATLWGGVQNVAGAIMLVTLFAVIVAGDIVSGEFTWGTIKLLLIRPASRTKILWSKYAATLLFGLFLLVLLFLSAFVMNAIFYGFAGAAAPYVELDSSGNPVTGNMLLHVLGNYGLKSIELLMIVTLAFMISTVFRSSSLAIGLSIFIMFTGQTIAGLLLRWDWGKYFLFANTDLSRYIEGRPPTPDMTMGFSVTVLVGYFVLFHLLSWFIFNKRDVAA